MISYQISPEEYKHWKLEVSNKVAFLILDIDEDGGIQDGYQLKLNSYDTSKEPGQEEITCIAKIQINGEEKELTGKGNGPINAFVHALEQEGLKDFKLTDYRQHSIGEGSATESAAYVQLQTKVGRVAYGCGIDSSIEKSGLLALVSAYNRTR